MLGMLGGGENMWLAIHDGAIALGVSLHKEMAKLISARDRTQDAAAGTQTAEPLVIPTVCLFSFVVGEHGMRPTGTCYHLNCHCRRKLLLNFEKFKQKTRHIY